LRPGVLGQNRDEESIETLSCRFSGNSEFHSVGSRPWAVGRGLAHQLEIYSAHPTTGACSLPTAH
jgi:hypothetical protein